MLIDQLPELNSLNDTDEVPVERGTTSYKAKITAFFGKFVKKIGDTISGALIINSSGAEKIALQNPNATPGTAPSSLVNLGYIYARGSTSYNLGWLGFRYGTDRSSEVRLTARNNGTGSNIDNTIGLKVDYDGTKTVDIDSAAWLSALNAGMYYTATAENIATAASGCEITTAQYEQWGMVAQLRLVITKTAAVSSGTTTLATLVTGKRPKMNTSAQMGWGTGTNGALIGASGAVQVSGAITAGQSITITAIYMLA